MTVNEAIAKFKALMPGHRFSDDQIAGWLSEVDGLIYEEIVSWHVGAEDMPHGPYVGEDHLDDVLLVRDPYTEVYMHYLSAQANYWNAEMARYNNSMVMYNVALSRFADWYNRHNMPKQPSGFKYRIQEQI